MLSLLFFVICIFFATKSLAADANPNGKPSSVPGYTEGAIRGLLDQVQKTGIGFDGITALFKPEFVTVSDASLSMDDAEVVFIVEYPEGITRIYPQRILVWHEAINDVLPDKSSAGEVTYTAIETADRRYTISYSPLSGTVVGFRSIAGRFPTTFGVTGDLINANSIFYDRISHSLWSQLLGVCFDGALAGKRLERIQVVWARWKGVKERYMGKAEVLSRYTGFKRAYGKDPYGSYQDTGNYYDDTRIFNTLSRLDKRLHPKKHILGIEYESMYAAVQVDAVKTAKILNFTLGLTPMVAIYDEELDAVRIFDRRLEGKRNEKPLTFAIFEESYIDEETRSKWTAEGMSTYGKNRDKKLIPIYTIDSMWMSWAAFHPNCPIFPYNNNME